MKFAAKIVALLAFTTATAFASCPQSAPYGCHPTYGGKMQCGCGQ